MPQRYRRFSPATSLPIAILALMPAAPARAQPPAAPSRTAMTLDVDATDAPMKILHATMTMPARPGAMTLFYPKWIPGEHMPSGPIANLTGLHIFADGAELEWRRDLVEMNAFAIDGAGRRADADRQVRLRRAVPAAGRSASPPSTNAKIAVINWYTVGLYPMGESPDAITVTAIAEGAGRLEARRLARRRVAWTATRFTTRRRRSTMLNDHPVLLGEHFRSITLWPAGSPAGEHVIDVVADSEWALQFPQSRIEAYKKIVLEERARLRRRRPLPQVSLAADAQRQPRLVRRRASRVRRRSRRREHVRRRRRGEAQQPAAAARVLPFVERQGAAAGRPGHRRLREADEGRPAVGLRGADQLLRRAAGRARRPDLRAGVDRARSPPMPCR